MPGRCNKMIDYVNKENMESVRGIENPGMMGEMGKIIGFYRLYRQTAEEEWEEKAEVLLDEVMENCSLELPVTYGDGLCGVGVGIEYLLQEGFVEGENARLLFVGYMGKCQVVVCWIWALCRGIVADTL